MEIFVLKPFVLGKFSIFSWMWNDALMHREGLKGYIYKTVMKNIAMQIKRIRQSRDCK